MNVRELKAILAGVDDVLPVQIMTRDKRIASVRGAEVEQHVDRDNQWRTSVRDR